MVVAIPSDYTIIGTVLAIAVAILLLSGLALYVAFRVRETLRDEKGRGARAAKVAFLIGLLFLSGGVFYFFASGFNVQTGTLTSSTTISSVSSSLATSQTTSSTSSGTSISSTTSITTATSSSATTSTTTTLSSSSQAVSMPPPQCPSQVTTGQVFECTIYIYNLGSTTFSSAVIVSSGTFYDFTFVSCTESANGGGSTSVSVSAHTISVGNIVPGTTVLTLTVQAPSQPGQYGDNVLTLSAPGLPQPISDTFSIQVTR